MGWFGNKKGGGGSNDNTSSGYDKARKNFDQGKSPKQTRNDLDRARRQETPKPVPPKK